MGGEEPCRGSGATPPGLESSSASVSMRAVLTAVAENPTQSETSQHRCLCFSQNQKSGGAGFGPVSQSGQGDTLTFSVARWRPRPSHLHSLSKLEGSGTGGSTPAILVPFYQEDKCCVTQPNRDAFRKGR